MKTTLKQALLLTLCLSSASAMANEQRICQIKTLQGSLEKLYKGIYEHSQGMLDDFEKSTDYMPWGRVRQAFEATSDKTLNELFNPKHGGLSKKDLQDLYWAVKTGEVQSNHRQEQMIEELYMLADDLGKDFWSSDNQSYHIRMALRRMDARKGFNEQANVAADYTDMALQHTEREVLARAIREGQRSVRYENHSTLDKIHQFFVPHYDNILKLIEVNHSLRKVMQRSYVADGPIMDAIAKYSDKLNFSPEGMSKLQALVSDTADKMASVRQTVSKIYGRELTISDPLKEKSIELREIFARRPSKNEIDAINVKAAEREAELDMDVLDQVLAEASGRSKQAGPRPMEEYHDDHLKIRYPQYKQETSALSYQYDSTTHVYAKNSSYRVEKEWQVTVHHAEPKTRQVTRTREVSDGQGGTKTESYTETEHYIDHYDTYYDMQATDSLKARIEEVLDNQVVPKVSELSPLPSASTQGRAHATGATNGEPRIIDKDESRIQEILTQGEKVRASEVPTRQTISRITRDVDNIASNYSEIIKTDSSWKTKLAEMDQLIHQLEQQQTYLKEYLKNSKEAVTNQWAHDVHDSFYARNQKMLERTEHMIKRIRHFQEQIRRKQESPELTYQLPNYDEQLKLLHSIMVRQRVILGIATTAATSAIGYAVYNAEELKEQFDKLMKKLFGEEETAK